MELNHRMTGGWTGAVICVPSAVILPDCLGWTIDPLTMYNTGTASTATGSRVARMARADPATFNRSIVPR